MDHMDGLRKSFGQQKGISFHNAAPNYPVIKIRNEHAAASIALHGAHVMDYQPHDQNPVLWMSGAAVLQEGKALRGGVPVCWPWFGDHPADGSLPAHGFARNRFWSLTALRELEDGATEIVLHLADDDSTRSLWPYFFDLSLTVAVGSTLEVSLRAVNRGQMAVQASAALHTYLSVGEIGNVALTGLEGVEYIDKAAGNASAVQAGAVRFCGEIDRVYQETDDAVEVSDPVMMRNLRITKGGSRSTVVWNPWIAKSADLADFESDGYRRMLCIEAANAGADTVEIAPGAAHTLSTGVSVEPYRPAPRAGGEDKKGE